MYFFLLREDYKRPEIAIPTIIIAWIYGLAVLWFEPYKKFPLLMTSYFTTITDILLITTWMFATGGINSPFHLLLYLSIISIALRYSARATLFASVFYILVYLVVFSEDITLHFTDVLVRLIYLVFAAIASGFLSSEAIERIRDKIIIERSEKQARITEMKLRKILGKLKDQIKERLITEKKLQAAQTELEQKVLERTTDLYKSNQLLKQEIIERKKIEEQLHFKIRELDTFIYRATHDIRGPLSSILGLVNLTRTEDPPDKILPNLDMIEKSVKRLDSILLDLLHVSMLKHGKLHYSYINMQKLVDEIILSVQNSAQKAHVEFHVSVIDGEKVWSDKTLLVTVMQNLIENAIKYRDLKKTKHEIKIEISPAGEESMLILIKDNGIGIPENIREKVFDMFFRGTNQSPGTGLGLYIVKNAVEKLGGEVSLQSEIDKGSVFTLILPYKTDQKIHLYQTHEE